MELQLTGYNKKGVMCGVIGLALFLIWPVLFLLAVFFNNESIGFFSFLIGFPAAALSLPLGIVAFIFGLRAARSTDSEKTALYLAILYLLLSVGIFGFLAWKF